MNSIDFSHLFDYDAWPSRLGQGWGDAARTSEYDQIDFHVDLGCGKLCKARIGVDRYPAPGVNIVTDLENALTYGLPRAPGEDALADGMIWPGDFDVKTGALRGEADWLMHVASGNELRTAWNPTRTPLHFFEDNSIESIVSSHFFEHVDRGFIPLVDDIWRVLKPGGILRAITPLFPSWSAVQDPDHRRYFMADENNGQPVSTWTNFLGDPEGNSWLESFSVPYTKARFELLDQDYTPRSFNPMEWWTPADARELRVALRAIK